MRIRHLLKRTAAITLLLVLVIGTIPAALPNTEASQGNPSPNIGNTFPSVHINILMEDIHYSDWQSVTVSIGNTAAEYMIDNAEAEIRGRGNTTWMLDKKPFRIRFKEARSMLDAGHSARTWTFLADHSDKSLMRNYSAYRLASKMDGMSAAPYGRHVNVYLGGEYQGVYLMSIQVSEIAEGRVNLSYSSDPALCEYLIEMDDRAPDGGTLNGDYVTVGGNHYAISFPSGDRLTPAHVRYISDYLTEVDDAIAARDPAVFPLIHLPSFVDFYIVQELYKNADIGFSSVFMQIKGQGELRRLEMGPVWDFDVSAGNAVHTNYSPRGIWAAERNTWYRGLSEMPVFNDALVSRWNGVKNAQISETISNIKYMEKTYRTSYQQNFSKRWNTFNSVILYNTPEIMRAKSHSAQVQYLTKFLETRKAWLDRYFNTAEPSLSDLKTIGTAGWVRWGTNWYFLNDKGRPVTGWLEYEGEHFYFNDKGVMLTGWVKQKDDTWYYLRPNGIMTRGGTLEINGKEYSFDAAGKWIPPGDDIAEETAEE